MSDEITITVDDYGPVNAIRFWRERLGLTQIELAESAGVSVRTLRRYEYGERDSLGMYVRFCGAMGIVMRMGLDPLDEHSPNSDSAEGDER